MAEGNGGGSRPSSTAGEKGPHPEADTSFSDIRDLAGGALVTFVGKVGRLSRAAFLAVVALFCGLEVVGAYSVAWGFVATVNRVARFGLQRGVVRFLIAGGVRRGTQSGQAASGPAVDAALAASLLIGALASAAVVAALLLATGQVAAFYHKPGQLPLQEPLRILAWSAPFVTASWIFLSATRALRIMRYAVYVFSIAGPLLLLAGSLGIALIGGGTEWTSPAQQRAAQSGFAVAVAWVQLGTAAASGVLAARYFGRHFSLRRSLTSLRGAPVAAMARFSAPVMLADLMVSVLIQLDVLMLGKLVSLTEVGIYSVARRVASSMLKAVQAFDPVFSSVVSELSHLRREEEVARRFVVISRWLLTVNLPIFATLFIVGDSLLGWAGEKWVGEPTQLAVGLKILYVLAVGMLLQGTFAIIEPLLAMTGRPGLNTFNNSLWLLANFALNLWFITGFGVVGAAYGATLSMFFVNSLRLLQVWRLHRIRPLDRSQVKPLAAAAAAAGAAWLASAASAPGSLPGVALACATFIAAYGLLLWRMGFEQEDRLLLQRAVSTLGSKLAGGRSSP
ncbi:MAG: polysaccharide biosynthesis C-terminal domain-containing protein [Gemmatimonadetes bacterium]|nr:polysaccharide biosynthesis C-terminal domain-containing protein [Gemmatimonadota bacterium]